MIAGIAHDLPSAIATEFSADNGRRASTAAAGDLLSRLETEGATLAATSSGYLQFVRYSTLVDIAVEADAIVASFTARDTSSRADFHRLAAVCRR